VTRGGARTVDGMKPRVVVSALATAAAAAALLAGCGGYETAKAPAPSGGSSKVASSGGGVKIANFAFSPATLTVSGSGRITVTNDDSTAHTFTADDGHSFDTGSIDPGSSSSVTAPKPGRYAYHCSIHPFMHGTLVVH
jgi:plastocyanin